MREWAYSQFACFHLALALCIYRTEQNEMVCCGPVYGIASSDTVVHKYNHSQNPTSLTMYVYTDIQLNIGFTRHSPFIVCLSRLLSLVSPYARQHAHTATHTQTVACSAHSLSIEIQNQSQNTASALFHTYFFCCCKLYVLQPCIWVCVRPLSFLYLISIRELCAPERNRSSFELIPFECLSVNATFVVVYRIFVYRTMQLDCTQKNTLTECSLPDVG